MKETTFRGVCVNCGYDLWWSSKVNKFVQATETGTSMAIGKPIVIWKKKCLCSDEERVPHVR